MKDRALDEKGPTQRKWTFILTGTGSNFWKALLDQTANISFEPCVLLFCWLEFCCDISVLLSSPQRKRQMSGHPGLLVQSHVDMVREREPGPVVIRAHWLRPLSVTWSLAQVRFLMHFKILKTQMEARDFSASSSVPDRVLLFSFRWCQHCGGTFSIWDGEWHRAIWDRSVFLTFC